MGSVEQLRVYVVYPAALFDGWEVVTEDDEEQPIPFEEQDQAIRYAEAQARSAGGGVVKVEDWYGHLERIWEVRSATPAAHHHALAAG